MKGVVFMNKITVKNIEISITGLSDDDFVSLTDIARIKNSSDTNGVISNWLRRVDTLFYLALWEKLNNNSFKTHRFRGV